MSLDFWSIDENLFWLLGAFFNSTRLQFKVIYLKVSSLSINLFYCSTHFTALSDVSVFRSYSLYTSYVFLFAYFCFQFFSSLVPLYISFISSLLFVLFPLFSFLFSNHTALSSYSYFFSFFFFSNSLFLISTMLVSLGSYPIFPLWQGKSLNAKRFLRSLKNPSPWTSKTGRRS